MNRHSEERKRRLLSQTPALGISLETGAGMALVPTVARPAAAADSWGRLPLLALTAAFGLLLLAVGYRLAPDGSEAALGLFWGGLLLMVAPGAARLIRPDLARPERIGLVLLAGMGLYLVKVLHSPTLFTFSDELQHWRTADDLLRSGRLFSENPLLPVSPLYPGLEGATVALAQVGGMSIFAAGVLVLGVARLVGTLGLFLFYERVSGSARAGGLAALLYMANPSYVFFDAQFAYESLALPLLVLALYAATRRDEPGERRRMGLTLVAVAAIAAVVVTHHVTTYALIPFLAVWTLTARFTANRRPDQIQPWGLLLLTLVMALAWLAYAAVLTLSYLTPPLRGAGTALLNLIFGEAVGRELFRATSGELAPLWERALGFGSVVLILLGLPLGFLQIWRQQRANAPALALAISALGYPLTLALRLTEQGAEASNRTSAFVFIAVAYVLATSAVAWSEGRPFVRLPRLATAGTTAPARARPGWRAWLDAGWYPQNGGLLFQRRWALAFAAWASAIFAGGLIIGWAPWARLPGPYRVAADTRSIDGQGLALAEWARTTLGPANRVAADRTNRLLLGAYGEQRPITNFGDGLPMAQVILAQNLGRAELEIIRRSQVRYLVVDYRMTRGLPSAGVYIERGEPLPRPYRVPVDPARLAKFEGVAGIKRVYDGGDILVYDVGALHDQP